MMEVEVLEITRSHLQELGIEYPTVQRSRRPAHRGIRCTSRYRSAEQEHHYRLVSRASVNLLKQAGITNVARESADSRAQPREGQDTHRFTRPVITNTVTPVSTGTPVVTGSVQYLDVGLSLEVEPTVYLDSDVAIKVNLEVSSILKEVPGPNGSLAYQIARATRARCCACATAKRRYSPAHQRSGHAQLAAYSGPGRIPIIGRLFGSERTHARQERDRVVDHAADNSRATTPAQRHDGVLVRHRDQHSRHAIRRAGVAGAAGSAARHCRLRKK